MIPERDTADFELLIEVLGPWLDRAVIIGGWAHRLFRNHPLAQTVPYLPLMTRDADVALPAVTPKAEQNLRDRLFSRGFHEIFLGEDRPPVTHYCLGSDDLGFYVEFLTPLLGSEVKRNQRRDVTIKLAGINAQKVRYLDVLLIEPWSVASGTGGVRESLSEIKVPNAVSYIAQKLLISSRRKPYERAKDFLYVHDTLELFGGAIPELRRIWTDTVGPRIGSSTRTKVQRTRRRCFAGVTDTIREAALMAVGRRVSSEGLLEVCQFGCERIFAET